MRKSAATSIIQQIFRKSIIHRYTKRRLRKVQKTKRKRQGTKYLKYKEFARTLVEERIVYWNTFYGFTYGKVYIKDQKTRWGSCSSKGNLNFSYKLIFLPLHLVDYIVVHELCHLKEFNHGSNFWRLIAETIPDYTARANELKLHGRKYVIESAL